MCAMASPSEKTEGVRCHFKILVPAAVVGSIMGRSGEVVNALENETGAKIMISGLQDCYPGTRERVCLISGTLDSILAVNRKIMLKMSEHPELCRGRRAQNSWRPKQVKIIIPQCAASKVIGKGGSNIERMKAESKSLIQLSRKPFPVALRERCVTVSGDFDGNDLACRFILDIIAPDTDCDFYKNVSYSQSAFPLPSAYMSGSPIARADYAANLQLPQTAITRKEMVVYLESFTDTLEKMGFPENTVTLSSDALLTLTDHRVMDVCLSLMLNWFYPRAYAVYERNGGVASIGRAGSSGSGPDRASRDVSRSMFATAGHENPAAGQPVERLQEDEEGGNRDMDRSSRSMFGHSSRM